jgi:phage gp36-like protein
MALVVIGDLNTHIYPEILNNISRDNDAIITQCISDSENECKGYLSKFDLLKLFGDNETAPTINDPFLKRIVKDIASWHIVTLANPNVNMELFRTRYEDAIRWLKDVQKGMIDPEGWEYKTDDSETELNESSNIQFSSNPKQTHFL